MADQGNGVFHKFSNEYNKSYEMQLKEEKNERKYVMQWVNGNNTIEDGQAQEIPEALLRAFNDDWEPNHWHFWAPAGQSTGAQEEMIKNFFLDPYREVASEILKLLNKDFR
jgi:hypothetical protein